MKSGECIPWYNFGKKLERVVNTGERGDNEAKREEEEEEDKKNKK